MPPAPGCQRWPFACSRRPGSSCQVCAAVGRPEQRGVFDAGIDGVGIGQRRLEMPDAFEFPRMLRAVVPLVRAGHAVVDELVADRLPRFAAVVRALDHLPEPAAGLRRIDAVRISGRAFEVINLPAREMRPADFPFCALPVRREDERAFACTDEYSNFAHTLFLAQRLAGAQIQLRPRPGCGRLWREARRRFHERPGHVNCNRSPSPGTNRAVLSSAGTASEL